MKRYNFHGNIFFIFGTAALLISGQGCEGQLQPHFAPERLGLSSLMVGETLTPPHGLQILTVGKPTPVLYWSVPGKISSGDFVYVVQYRTHGSTVLKTYGTVGSKYATALLDTTKLPSPFSDIIFSVKIRSLTSGSSSSPSESAALLKDCQQSTFKSEVDWLKLNSLYNHIVQLPAATCTWRPGDIYIPGGIYVMGSAGTVNGVKFKTKIFQDSDASSAGSPSNNYLLNIDCTNGKRAIVGNIDFSRSLNLPENPSNGVRLYNSCKNFHVYNNSFNNFAGSALAIRGDALIQYGLINNNKFGDSYYNYQSPSKTSGLGYGVVIAGADNFASIPLELGTGRNVFIEDNFFVHTRHAVASNNSSTFVFRNNIVGDNASETHAIDAHGPGGNANAKTGSRSYEIYNNKINISANPSTYGHLYIINEDDNSSTPIVKTPVIFGGNLIAATGPRGGDGVIFGNQITGSSTQQYRISIEGCSLQTAPYPLVGQIRSLYLWNNTTRRDSASVPVKGLVTNTCKKYLQEGRDYFVEVPRPNYKPYIYPHPLAKSF